MKRRRIKMGPLVGVVAGVLIALGGGCADRANAPASRPTAFATENAPSSRPVVNAEKTRIAPALNAAAADPAWAVPPAITAMTQPLATNEKYLIIPTQIRLLWDEGNLYIRFTTTGPKPYSPFGNTRDAKQYQGDAVEVFLDPVGDGRQYFELQISAANGVLDQNTLITADPKYDADGRLTLDLLKTQYWPNVGYDIAGLRTATSVAQHGDEATWITDIAIPADVVMHRLGKTQLEPRSLRMNFLRYHWTGPIDDTTRKLQPLNWSPTRWGCPHQSPAAMGTVELKE